MNDQEYSRFDGVSYQAKLATEAGRWSGVELPFVAMTF